MSKKMKTLLWVTFIVSTVGAGLYLSHYMGWLNLEPLSRFKELGVASLSTVGVFALGAVVRVGIEAVLTNKKNDEEYVTNLKINSETELKEAIKDKMEQDSRIELKLDMMIESKAKVNNAISKMKYLPDSIKEAYLEAGEEKVEDLVDGGINILDKILDTGEEIVDKAVDGLVDSGLNLVDKLIKKL